MIMLENVNSLYSIITIVGLYKPLSCGACETLIVLTQEPNFSLFLTVRCGNFYSWKIEVLELLN